MSRHRHTSPVRLTGPCKARSFRVRVARPSTSPSACRPRRARDWGREPLTRHLADVQRLHARDLPRGVGRVVLPFALERTFPNAPAEWRWQFVFPATRICRDPQFGPPSRYHLHESVIQTALAHAARAAGITKRVPMNRFGWPGPPRSSVDTRQWPRVSATIGDLAEGAGHGRRMRTV